MSSRSRGQHAVLLVTPPSDWKPSHFSSLPPAIESAKFYARRLHLHEAVAITRAGNTQRLQSPDGLWMLLVIHTRSCNRYINRCIARHAGKAVAR